MEHLGTIWGYPPYKSPTKISPTPQVPGRALAFINPAAAPRAVSASKKLPLPVATGRQGCREVNRASWRRKSWRKLWS